MKKSSTSERLKEILRSKNLKQVDVLRLASPICNKYGVKLSKSDLSQYVSGKVEPGQEKLSILGIALNVNEAWLMGYDVPMSRTAPSSLPALLPAEATPFNPQNTAPLLGTVRAGLPMYAEENIEGYIPIMQNDGAKYFWLRVSGDSMNAAGMADGDQILVREQPEVENGQPAVVIVNGDEATVKYFRREGNLIILTPKSFNPEHQPQVYDLKNISVRVVGLVVECRKVF